MPSFKQHIDDIAMICGIWITVWGAVIVITSLQSFCLERICHAYS